MSHAFTWNMIISPRQGVCRWLDLNAERKGHSHHTSSATFTFTYMCVQHNANARVFTDNINKTCFFSERMSGRAERKRCYTMFTSNQMLFQWNRKGNLYSAHMLMGMPMAKAKQKKQKNK